MPDPTIPPETSKRRLGSLALMGLPLAALYLSVFSGMADRKPLRARSGVAGRPRLVAAPPPPAAGNGLAAPSPPPPPPVPPTAPPQPPASTVDHALVRRFRATVAARLSERARADEDAGNPRLALADEQLFAQSVIRRVLGDYANECLRQGVAPLDEDTEDALAQAVFDAMYGLGRLQRLLDTPGITDISINRYDRVFLTYPDGSKQMVEAVADSDAELEAMIRMAAARLGLGERRFDEGTCELDLRLPDGSRLSAVMGLCENVAVSIRLHRLVRVFLDDLVRLGAIDYGLREFLAALVRARKTIVIGGGTGAGKTTCLRALANEVPPHERLVTMEKARELDLDKMEDLHPDVVALETRDANTEGEGEKTLEDLVRRGLRMRPDRAIVGEVLGDEVVDMLNALSQGNEGSLSTVHANSAAGIFQRIRTYAIQSPERLTAEAANQMIAGAIDFAVFIQIADDRHRGGKLQRVVSSVVEVVGADSDGLHLNEVFVPASPDDPRAVPDNVPRCIDDLIRHGYDPSLFERPGGWWDA